MPQKERMSDVEVKIKQKNQAEVGLKPDKEQSPQQVKKSKQKQKASDPNSDYG